MIRLLASPWSVVFLVTTACIGGGTVAFGEQETGVETRAADRGSSEHNAPAQATLESHQRVLQAPTNEWDGPSPPKNNPGRSELLGKAFHYDAFVYDKAGDKPGVAGIIRRGSILRVGGIVNGSGCKNGTWYKAEPFGYVCTSLGFHVSGEPSNDSYGVPPAKVEARLPYQYARVTTKRAPRYYRMPTVQEEKQARRAMQKKGPTPEAVSSLMEGDYFLALAETETREADGAVFYRTVRNRYVREDDLELRNPEVVRGEQLGKDGWELPIGFVYGEDRPL
ncbi:MAG: hypothetical protein OES69_15360, partial [Myxococcales bacterium]|nr:hypothetical protein [Myxococcales bacterium]